VKKAAVVNQHEMTLFNHDLRIMWHREHDYIKITEVHILYNDNHDLHRFMSGKVFKFIVEDIENTELNKK
jgi:hypothetical protein